MEKVVNDTSSAFSVDELTYRMREELVNSGQAAVVMTGGWGTKAESKAALEAAKSEEFYSEGGGAAPVRQKPDFTLSGRITDLKRRDGDVRQTTYTFRLTLADFATGNEIWTKTSDVTKQGTKPSVGW